MVRSVTVLIILVVIGLSMSGCNHGPTDSGMVVSASLKAVPESAWENLSTKKIVFGHQSVGFNIIDGITDLTKEHPQIQLRFVQTTRPEDFTDPVFGHFRVGKNADPKSKIDAFSGLIESGIGEKVDIAFFKLCFVDIFPHSDIEKIFADYKSAMAELKKKFPRTTFVHVTVPLTSDEVGLKALWKSLKDRVKALIGKTNFYDNRKRNEFNEMMRQEYSGKEPLFDLARIQSTYPDGKELTSIADGKTHYTLIPDYTYDAGHLNELGRKIVAEKLLLLLVQLTP